MSDLIERLEVAAQWDDSPSSLIHEAIARIAALEAQLSEALSRTGAVKVTEAMVEAGLEYYAEGGCGGLADHERREVVEAIIEAALNAAMDAGRTE